MMKKLRVGWFTFTCCEDSTIIFTEMFNDNYKKWQKLIDFVHFKTLQANNRWEEMDVAFVEGAITSSEQEKKLKKIRSLTKKLVAIGSCACIAMPSGQRNQFDEATKAEIQFLLDRFKYSEKVQKLSDLVQVDDQVKGCPMNEEAFITILNKYLKEFAVIS